MNVVSAAAALLLIVAALYLAALYDASFGAVRPTPLPRCLAAVGDNHAGWVTCW